MCTVPLYKSDSCFFCCQNHSSLFLLLFVCLLSHFCSSSESNSDLDKRKSEKKDKDKAKRYESTIFIWKRKLLHFHHYSLSRSSIPPQIILLWTSLIREHQKYFWNVTVLPLNPQTAMVIGLGLCGLPACSLLDLMVIGHYTVNIAEIFQTFTVFWVWQVVNSLPEN